MSRISHTADQQQPSVGVAQGSHAAGGTGHLLARQLLPAGERVLDVQPELGARVRLLAAGDVDKDDPDDARSVAVAALRPAGVRQVRPDDHAGGAEGMVKALP